MKELFLLVGSERLPDRELLHYWQPLSSHYSVAQWRESVRDHTDSVLISSQFGQAHQEQHGHAAGGIAAKKSESVSGLR